MPFSVAISTFRTPLKSNYWLLGFVLVFLVVWVSTFIGTSDMSNWMLENLLVFIFLGFLLLTYKRHQFSDLTYLLICVYLCLHVYGSKYTYAENPLGFWLQDQFNWSRNHYDRIVHFSFGFLLAYPMRALFLAWLRFPGWVCWLLPFEISLSCSKMFSSTGAMNCFVTS